MNYDSLQWAFLIVFLVPLVISDIKNKKISAWFIVCGLITALIKKITTVTGMPVIWELVLQSIPGFALLILAYLAKGCLGKGDGLAVILIGNIIGFKYAVLSLFFGFVIAGIFGATMVVLRKMNRKSEIPFIPFIGLGVLICSVI